MRNFLYVLLALFITTGVAHGASMQLGKPVTLTEITKVSEINKDPEQFVGKEVVIEGMIIDVCSKRGCWMDVASDVPFEKIQVKVVDGVIVFPMEAKGKTAKVQGVVEALRLSKKQAIELGEHKAEESGKSFDPSTVKGPVNIYRIRGLGAVIN